MDHSVSISKITPPYLPQILYRPRLVNLIEANKDKKLILILGQAAQGKTTLAASYVKTSNIPFAWVNLDKSESDPFLLFQFIIHSLQRALKGVDFSNLLSYPQQIMGPREEIPLYREWTQSVFKEVSIPIQVVIDGLDRLSPGAPSFKFLQTLVEDSPANICFLFLTREIPPPVLEFQHLKIRQQALVLTNEEVAFTRDEIKEFFREIKGVSLDQDQLEKIYNATGGWVGGLVLLSESLRSSHASRIESVIQGLPDRFHREVFQYFGKEIFASQRREVQQFLLESSMIDIIEPSLMKTLLKTENAEEILRDHVRRNLFVQSFYDEKKGWLYRYQPMFRNFLKAKCLSELSVEERASLNLRAGVLYEQRGELEGAIRYFLEAKAYPQAISLIERVGTDLLKKGRKSDLASWIYTLPEERVQENPWLLFYLTMAKEFIADGENVVSLKKIYELFKKTGDIKGELRSLAQLLLATMRAGIRTPPVGELIGRGEALLEYSKSDDYKYECAILWYSIGSAHFLGDGNIREGIRACENAYLIAKQIKDLPLQAYALNYSAMGLLYVGEFHLAEKTCKKIETMIDKSAHLKELAVVNLMVNCILSNYRGDFDETRRLAKLLRVEIQKYGYVSIYPWSYEITGYLELMTGNSVEAEEVANHYLSTTRALKNAFLKGLALRLLGLIYLFRKEFKGAREAIDQSLDALSREAPSRYVLNRVKIISGLICYEMKEVERGERELQEALEYFSSIMSYNTLVETHFAFAFLKQHRNQKDEAAFHLRKGFEIAANKEYQHFYFLGTIYSIKACLLALELKVQGATDYITRLLTTRFYPAAEEGLKGLSNHPDPQVREKVSEIRRTIHRSKVPCLRILTLGALQVFRGDSQMKETEWDRIQPKKLLEAIISYGGRSIPKEILIDELWPEESPGAAEKNFKTTLQRLRKSLENSIHKDFSSSYVHLHDNVVHLDPELCQVDAERFLSLLRMAEEKEKRGEAKSALSLYKEALEMYKGDFLPEELYAPWVEKKREELKRKLIASLNRMARLYEKQGAVKKAIDCYNKVIQEDPLLEEAYQRLMTFYSNKGMYNDALRIYEACKKVLKKDLKSKPDATTSAIYRKVLENVGSSPATKRKGRGK